MKKKSNFDDKPDDGRDEVQSKRVVLIRHGCTYMNEHLGIPGNGWGSPGFTDIFPTAKEEENEEDETRRKYRDSPLSPLGIRQAQSLSNRLRLNFFNKQNSDLKNIMNEIDLIVVSPLTRALQTTELGLLPNLKKGNDEEYLSDNAPPIIALPYAAERLYLISDVGMSTNKLSTRFPWVDFDSGFITEEKKQKWWFSTLDQTFKKNQYYELEDISIQTKTVKTYQEWRPTSQGQVYANVGEPDDYFANRMKNLVDWIDKRDEQTIALVCHWGVIDHLIGEDFDNCEMRVVDFEKAIKSKILLTSKY